MMARMPRQAIEEFKELYRQHFGVELSNHEAEARARNFINLYVAILRDEEG